MPPSSSCQPLTYLSPKAVPACLSSLVKQADQRLLDALEQADQDALLAGTERPSRDFHALGDLRRAQLTRVVSISTFALDTLTRTPGLLASLEANDELDQSLGRPALEGLLAQSLAGVTDEDGLQRVLRRFRRARMLGILWRDLTRPDGTCMWSTAAAVTALAEVCLDAALAWLGDLLAPRLGRPAKRSDGRQQGLVVLGMGKLGAGELNLSSDIDLIFAYPEAGDTQGGRKSLDHQEYFTKLGQKLIAALDPVTADGFVFRVDMRLRPLGEGGPLVGSFAALGAYYQDQGREWERYAMLKARPVAGDRAAGEALLASLRPFVYRKYLDFGAIESLRELKAMINREVRRRGMEHNIKLGSGGIREVEFVAQAFQLIRGGRDTELQVTSLKTALERLPALGLLPSAVVDALIPDYTFLRDIEHVLQGLEDRQTQQLPEDPMDRLRLAVAMREPDWTALMARLDAVRHRVRQHFDAVVADPEADLGDASEDGEPSSPMLDQWRQVWRDELEPDAARDVLQAAGFAEPAQALSRLRTFYHSRPVQAMQRIGFERLDALMPLLLDALSNTTAPDTALPRVQPLLEAVLRRTAYLALMRENPQTLDHLLHLCAASPWIAERVARYPILLDELLTPDALYTPADKARLEAELRQALNRIPEDDEEAQLETLRIFKQAQMLHVAASDIAGTRHLMKVSDYLTYIAEVILEAVLSMAWKHLVRKHGTPPGRSAECADFLIIGYGKLGGIELGYGSDLDLVFLHANQAQGVTNGPRPIDTPLFYTRLGQRVIHLLTAVTPAGSLYEVDMRLRPSGSAGQLVTSLEAFADYQHQHAWTWEHQALVRARAVAGSKALASAFHRTRAEVLARPRELDRLRHDVVAMRDKMRDHLASRTADSFNIKQDAGGMVDIEFICQFAVLGLSHQTPALLEVTDNSRLLDALIEAGHLPKEQAESLRQAYLAYRHRVHRAALTGNSSELAVDSFRAQRKAVRRVWEHFLGETSAGLQ